MSEQELIENSAPSGLRDMKTALLDAAFFLVHLLCPVFFVMCIVRVMFGGV